MNKIDFGFDTLYYNDELFCFRQTKVQRWKCTGYFLLHDKSIKYLLFFFLFFLFLSFCSKSHVAVALIMFLFICIILLILFFYWKSLSHRQILKRDIQEVAIDADTIEIVYYSEGEKKSRIVSNKKNNFSKEYLTEVFKCPIKTVPQRRTSLPLFFAPFFFLFGIVFIDGIAIGFDGTDFLRDLCALFSAIVCFCIILSQKD